MCFNLSGNTWFYESFTQLWLSQWIIVESIPWPNKYARSLWSHTASRTTTLNAIYSASVVLKATELCFLLHQDTMEDPKVKQQPDVLFRSTALPARSASAYPCKLMSTMEAYLRPYPIVPWRYLNTCFTTIQWVCLDWLMNWLSTFTA